MMHTPGQLNVRHNLEAVNYHTGEETVVIIHWRKRRKEVAELLEALLEKYPQETICVT